MDYNQTIHFLYTQYPAFEKQGGLAYKPGLDNVLGISEAFNNPHLAFKSIHVAGTNGKGSSSSMLAAILQTAGYKVGLYTSPHIHRFTERIRINGVEIPEAEVVNFVENNTVVFEQFKPSFFEITTILAFNWFAKQQVDIAIVETGMGGRLDATNIIHPEVSLITNVSLDHTQFLGNTLTAIASEKAGIIKQNTPVVVSEYQQDIIEVFENTSLSLNAPLIKAYEYYECSDLLNVGRASVLEIKNIPTQKSMDVKTDLQGIYQSRNILGVLSVLDVLKNSGWNISETAILEGLKQVQKQSGFKGRWQVVSDKPLVILDAAHNEAGMILSMDQLNSLNKKIHIVIGMVKDKDVSHIISLLPVSASYYFCQANNPRALSATELQQLAQQQGLSGITIPNVNEALLAAKNASHADDVIWVGGSLYVLGELSLN
ncbi:bifunctional folylpolyglutamate synthase/dihydrofolate synthase [Cytophaga aurantiaca]|uniref:bifunctional folylpolyglutamate synthase/dihydrofolate synthase n=1 Tax=Cytophaga aurantiaca TaxID=29530 RepID=UPI00035E615D|nr:folylpolyglutamate synthase/dihydrofolate synthase family protein [Cytophaga aurantiaca]